MRCCDTEFVDDVRWEQIPGWPSQVNLSHRISAYARHSTCFKIGITSNPKKRWAIYKAHATRYEEMIVLYETTSDRNVREMERVICEQYKEHADNTNAGGGGGASADGIRYLYIVRRRAN